MADSILGAERGQDLGVGVELHARALPVPARDRFAQLAEAEVRRIAMVGRVRRGLLKHADDPPGRRQVRVADTKRDDVHAGFLLGLHLAIDLGEEVGRDTSQSLGAGRGFAPPHLWRGGLVLPIYGEVALSSPFMGRWREGPEGLSAGGARVAAVGPGHDDRKLVERELAAKV